MQLQTGKTKLIWLESGTKDSGEYVNQLITGHPELVSRTKLMSSAGTRNCPSCRIRHMFQVLKPSVVDTTFEFVQLCQACRMQNNRTFVDIISQDYA